jgi:NAD(P)-dependent dehydrogenase (short-subunit alcohol dehydrogenase family)
MSDVLTIDSVPVEAVSAQYRRADRRVALVTGAGSGAGAAIVHAYAQAGMRVVVSDIDYTLAGAVAADVRNRGGQALAHRCDVASEEQVVALIERAQRDFGAISCVVNNAGPCLDDAPLEHWHRLVSANLLGTLLVTRHSLDAMQDRGGSIVNIAASVGLGLGAAAQPAYAAAKAGVLRFTAAMGFAHQDHGVRINCLVPDWIATESRLAWLAALSVEQRQTRGVPDVLNTPEQVAQAVLALSQRLDHAGRVVLCRAGQPLQLLPIDDVGYGQLEPF